MAKKNKKKRSPNERNVPPLPASKPSKKQEAAKPASASHQATRETVESLVIALVLAFLFRTFQAEAFVIPTGSMAPTLMGQHKDVYCDQCGQRFKINASSESPDNYPTSEIKKELEAIASRVAPPLRKQLREAAQSPAASRQYLQTVFGVCPCCRYPQPTRPDLPTEVLSSGETPTYEPTHSGDRILVNKYLYSFTEPSRWDVVVFKYPGNANRNYIKRLVGLPSEELRISGGDVYVRPAGTTEPHQIARKPPQKMIAMRQLVHDTKRDPSVLYNAGWPLRWEPDNTPNAWKVDANADGKRVRERYEVAAGDDASWLRYWHTPASPQDWQDALAAENSGSQPLANAEVRQLVTDFNSYNTEIDRRTLAFGRPLKPDRLGLHWVGDLMVEADIDVASDAGEVILEIVEAGRHHRCVIDTATGQARFEIVPFESAKPLPDFAPTASTPVKGPGHYRLRMANFDNALTLWVNDQVVPFEASTACPLASRLAPPRTSTIDPGDLSPVAIGAKDAELKVDGLRVYRDIYYIAATSDRSDAPGTSIVLDLLQNGRLEVEAPNSALAPVEQVAYDPSLWPQLAQRHEVDFATTDDQLFVMGDNSASSSDSRLWSRTGNDGGKPGGPYLERSLLTGKAVCVYWPHALMSIPTGKQGLRVPIVPNLGDIRLVR